MSNHKQFMTHCDRSGSVETQLRYCVLCSLAEDCVNAVDEHGKTPLMSAVSAGWCHVVAFFLERGSDPNLVDHQNTTALMQACSLGHKSIVSALLECNADVNYADHVSINITDELLQLKVITVFERHKQNFNDYHLCYVFLTYE